VRLSLIEVRELFIANLLIRVHFIIVMIRWTGLAPWEPAFHFPGSLTSTVLGTDRNQQGHHVLPSVKAV